MVFTPMLGLNWRSRFCFHTGSLFPCLPGGKPLGQGVALTSSLKLNGEASFLAHWGDRLGQHVGGECAEVQSGEQREPQA